MRGVGWQAGLLTVPCPGRLAFNRGRHTAGGCCGNSVPSPSSAAIQTCNSTITRLGEGQNYPTGWHVHLCDLQGSMCHRDNAVTLG